MASLISTAPGMTTNMVSVISSLVNIGLDWKKFHRLARNKSESKFRADLGVTKKIKKLYEYAWLQIGKEEAKYKLIKL